MCNASPDLPSKAPNRRQAAWAAELRPVGEVENWLVVRAVRAAGRVNRLAREADAVERSCGREADLGNDDGVACLEKREDRLRKAEATAERCVHQSLGLLARGRKQRIWVEAESVAEQDVESQNIEEVGPAAEVSMVDVKPVESSVGADLVEPNPESDESTATAPASAVAGPLPPSPPLLGGSLWSRISNPEGDLPASLPTIHLRM